MYNGSQRSKLYMALNTHFHWRKWTSYLFSLFLASFSSLSSGSDEDTSEVSQTLPSTPQKEGEKEGDCGELKKQEMLVQYLKDTETFALQVERAISVINSMLYWKTTSGTRWNFVFFSSS